MKLGACSSPLTQATEVSNKHVVEKLPQFTALPLADHFNDAAKEARAVVVVSTVVGNDGDILAACFAGDNVAHSNPRKRRSQNIRQQMFVSGLQSRHWVKRNLCVRHRQAALAAAQPARVLGRSFAGCFDVVG